MQAAFAAHLAHCASCRPVLPVCHMWHERHSSSALRAVIRLPAPWLLPACSAASHFIHFGCIAHTFSHAKRNCNRARVKGPKPAPRCASCLACPAPIPSLRWAAKCPVLCALLLGSLKLNLSTLTRCGWRRQAAGGRRRAGRSWLCDGNVKQTIRTRSAIVTLSRSPSLSACLSLSLSDIALSLSIAPSPSLSRCVLPKMQLFHCHNCHSPLGSCSCNLHCCPTASASPAASALLLLGRLCGNRKW